ncbi:MAG: hypothetical protein ACJ8BW_11470 [Ktedonobacteraceae bacterium]|jgi:hypothetical protein
MLTLQVAGVESFDDNTQEFIAQGGTVLELEHSLVSLSKWESIHEKPFLGKEPKTPQEIMSYVRCMTLRDDVAPEVFGQLNLEHFDKISEYIDAKMTATWFSEQPGTPRSREVITSELIYYWMTVFSIPFECERWHLNRLFTLIRICNVKQGKPEKMTRAELAQRNRELNAQRKTQMGTDG